MFDSEDRDCAKRNYPWFRGNPYHYVPMCQGRVKRIKFNRYQENAALDINTKKAALKASASIVALLSYTGEKELKKCSGVIIENDGTNRHTVLTSANLIRCTTEETLFEDNEHVLEDKLADNLKVMIYLYDGGSYEGEVLAYDCHYNLAWIQFQSDSSFPTARLRQVDDCINVNPDEEQSSYLRPHSSHFNLVPGHPIVAVGRYFTKPFDFMAAPGEFNVSPTDDFGCKEVFMGTCSITKCGEGGAIINLSGEVIGITFYETGFSPFLPINIAQKCWEYYKKYGRFWRPSLGIEATNLYTVDISHIEKVIHQIPSICNGVIVEKVIEGSSLDSAGLHVNDVIVRCGGRTVHSLLEFWEMVWDTKVGDVLPLDVVRVSENEVIRVNMTVGEVGVENFYRWPLNGGF